MSTPSLRIAFDVDGVLADFVGAVRAAMNLPPNWQPKQWDIAKDPLIGDERKAELYEVYKTPGLAASLAVIDDAAAVLTAVRAAGYDICYATAPMKSNGSWISERAGWLRQMPPGDIYQTDNKLEADAYVLIDDKPENVQAYADAGRVGILLRRPWNEHVPWEPWRGWYTARDLRTAVYAAAVAINNRKLRQLEAALSIAKGEPIT